MPRNYIRKTTNGNHPPELMLEAVFQVKAGFMSLRGAVKQFGIPLNTLARHVRKYNQPSNNQPLANKLMPDQEYIKQSMNLTEGLASIKMENMAGNTLL